MKKIGLCFFLISIVFLSACGPLWGSEGTATSSPAAYWTVDPSTPLPFATFTPQIISPTPTTTATPIFDSGTTITATNAPILYYAQSGDTLAAVAAHFEVAPEEIITPSEVSRDGLLTTETPLLIPQRLLGLSLSPDVHIMPDSEIIYSPSAVDFITQAYVAEKNGYLNTYHQYLSATGLTWGADAVQRIAIENSINPRLLLALIEYESGWVLGQPANLAQTDYPLGYIDFQYRYLYRQMMWAVQELGSGYYGWRSGALTVLPLADGTSVRIAPDLNAGSVAIQYFFARRYGYAEWLQAIDPSSGFPALYENMFGDPFARADVVEPLIPPSLRQPNLTLPFEINQVWSFTRGPHPAWGYSQDDSIEKEGPLAALDFAPAADYSGCAVSDAWVLASAPGRVVRTGNGVVMVDMDDDGLEQTGWNMLYMHIASQDRVMIGAWLLAGDRIGHPSCEGGDSSGTHIHIARKYSGEWILADGPLPFTMSGWVAEAGEGKYQGILINGDKIVQSNENGIFSSQIIRHDGE